MPDPTPDPDAVPDPASDPAILAAIGASVRARLAALPGARALGGEAADLFAIPFFLKAPACRRMVRVIDSRIGPSTLFSDNTRVGFRTSSTHHFDGTDPEVAGIARQISDLLGIDPAHAEVMQGQRYEAGQQYKHHFDYFHTDQPHWAQERRRGGQRTWTAMIYLNEPKAGGATDFPRLGHTIAPRAGMLLAWNNMDSRGLPNQATAHAGLPVCKGSKYVITQWYRQDHWSLTLR